MDPDLPMPSIERDEVVASHTAAMSTSTSKSGSTSRQSSPEKTLYRTPMSHAPSPAPLKISRPTSRAGTPTRERKSPVLQSKRSLSNLSVQGSNGIQYRRASSNLNPTSPGANPRPIMTEDLSRPLPWTASSVAKDYFRRELDLHTTTETRVTVIVHDACYGHRFSRPRATKAALNTIVERPERIHATLLGASTAYVRLGERHAGGAHGPHPDRNPAAATQQPFTIRKTSRNLVLSHPAVANIHGAKWMEELQIMCDSAEAKLAMNGKELSRPIGYGKDEEGNPLPKLHEGDLYLCSESLAALQGCLGGVCDAVDAVFSPSPTNRAFVCIRPPGHHCSADFPSGFCWLNNVHVGISYAAMTHGLTHAAIIDFDLHHGDGSQEITWSHNHKAQSLPKNAPAHKKTPIGYYSLHDINSYPCEWGDEDKVRNASLCIHNAHGQSIWNVHLEPWKSLDDFWKVYQEKYSILLDKTRSFLRHQSNHFRSSGVKPRAAIFLSAGFDASQWEGAGMQRHDVNVPTDFYARFTEDVVRLSDEEGLGVDGRVISVLEGGYSDRALMSGVLSHLCGLAHEPASAPSTDASRTTGLGGDAPAQPIPSTSPSAYDATWWHESTLQELEAVVAGHLPPPPKKKEKQIGNYSSPTHASTARMTEHARERQTLSTQFEARMSLESAIPDPPPDVDWTIASYELSRLLIPTDRQTLSCRHDELNAEATRARRERQSAIGLPDSGEDRRQLRDRRTKAAPRNGDASRVPSRTSNRRITIAAASELPDQSMVEATRPRRRSSAASSVLSSFQDMKLENSADLTASSESALAPSLPQRHKFAASQATSQAATKKTRQSTGQRQTRSQATSPTSEGDHFLVKTAHLVKNGVAKDKEQVPTPNTVSSTSAQNNAESNHKNGDDVDDITTAMKKISIKLKMPTPEQHAENQRKAQEEQQPQSLASTRPIKKTPAPRVVRTKPPAPVKVHAQPKKAPLTRRKSREDSSTALSSTLAQIPAAVHASQLPVKSPPPTVQQENLTQEQLRSVQQNLVRLAATAHSSGVSTTTPAPPVLGNNSSQGIEKTTLSDVTTTSPLGVTAAVNPGAVGGATPSEPASLLPERPEAPTPATIEQSEVTPPVRTKDDLPVFTSTSPIPFSSATSASLGEQLDRTGRHQQ